MTENNDWFVYDGTEVTGAFTAEILKDFEQKEPAKPLMVSKKGIDRWIAYNDFHKLYLTAHSVQDDVSAKKKDFQKYFLDTMQNLRDATTNDAVLNHPLVEKTFEPLNYSAPIITRNNEVEAPNVTSF